MADNNNISYTITSSDSLKILLTKKKNRYRKFIVDVKNMDESRAKNFENDLNKFHTSCGCATGQYFLSTSLVLCALYICITKLPVINWRIITAGVTAFLIVAFTGKITGKLIDGYKFKKTVEKLSYELNLT